MYTHEYMHHNININLQLLILVTAATTVSPQPDTNKEGSQKIIDELKRRNKILQEENADLKEKHREAEIQIAALQAQIQRQLGHHRSDIENIEGGWDKQVKLLKESEIRLQNELMKKAENHAEELREAFDSQQQLMKRREKEHQDLIRELNEHFQNEIKAAHYQWQQDIAHTWEIDREEIEISDVTIGIDRLGTIMKGNFRGIQVAVKKLHPDLVSEQNEKLVKWEINLLAQIRHPNLVLFLGAVISGKDESSFIITELMDMCLYSSYQQHSISAVSRRSVLSDVSSALTYLHTNYVPITHGGVSSSRVLLKTIGGVLQWKAKLGIANIIPISNSSMDRTCLYAAPEVIAANRRDQTEKVDVYSFGVLVCEVVLCRSPPEEREEFPMMLSDVHAKDQNLFQLAKNCTKLSHQDRPSMKEVTENLRALIDQGGINTNS